MAATLEKLRPDQDLQCYFHRPSAIAAISSASATGYTVSGCWRQQFDWAVVEWNRDNTFEHPVFRNLPDGDLSRLTLSYDERRINCEAIDSDVYPAEPWPYLRVWTDGSGADPHLVPLRQYAQAIEGSYSQAWCEFELTGVINQGDYAGLAACGEHHTHQAYYDDTIASVVEQIAQSINTSSNYLTATWNGSKIRLEAKENIPGTNGNRIGVYSYVTGTSTAQWSHAVQNLHDGSSPTRWHVELPFSSLDFATSAVRKLRWTYAASLQPGEFSPAEFAVEIANWNVTGEGREYKVAGPGSFRIENDAREVTLSQGWSTAYGNYSGGSIAYTLEPGEQAEIQFTAPLDSDVFLGTRFTGDGGRLRVTIDGLDSTVDLLLAGEDTLARVALGNLTSGSHEVILRHDGAAGQTVYFDYLELAVPCRTIPEVERRTRQTLATDWDTDHSIALAAERTAGMLKALGYAGRANHYAGALWFYELIPTGFAYMVKRARFSGIPEVNSIVTLELAGNRVEHLVHPGDSAETIATALALRINQGYTSAWASASGPALQVQARAIGTAGGGIDVTVSGGGDTFFIVTELLQSGVDGSWRTDLNATPRINRAARDWTRAYVKALHESGLDVACGFSMELQHGDPSIEAGIAQRYPSGNPVQLQTPALQTNFSPTSIAFWRQAYRDCAQLMAEAGVQPYLQFGEVQWWYFPGDGSGMPFCDAYTDQVFQDQFGRPARRIPNEQADPKLFQDEVHVYQRLVGEFTSQIMEFVKQSYPECRFEVLYPTDVNASPLNRAVNFAASEWTAANLDCLKTESFTFTAQRDMTRARSSILFGTEVGFPWGQRSHLAGISDPSTPWQREIVAALEYGAESAVLFALDQYCLIGYDIQDWREPGRANYFEL